MRQMVLAAAGVAAAASGCATAGGVGPPEITPVERIGGGVAADDARAMLDQGKHLEAAARYRAALQVDSGNIDARYGLAEALRLGGDPEAAKAEYLVAAKEPAWRVRAMEGLGSTNFMSGDHEGAYESFRTAVEEDAGAWRAWVGLAQLSDLGRYWDKSDESYAAAQAATSEPAIVFNNHGVSMLARGNPEKAVALFTKALQANPRLEQAQLNLEIANASRNASCDTAGAAEPDARLRAQKLNNVGYVAMLQGRLGEAQGCFERAIDAHPSFYAIAYQNLKVLQTLRVEAEQR